MPLLRFQKLPAKKRARLIEIATRHFAERGFEAASLNEIIAAAGLGKSSYYYYFEDKEDLYATCIFEAYEAILKELPPLPRPLKADDFFTKIEAYFQEAARVSQRFPLPMALFRELPTLRTRLADRFRNVALAWLEPVVEVIKQGQKLGVVRTDLEAHHLFRLAMAADNALDEVLLDGPLTPAQLQAHTALVFDTWKRLLAPAPAPRPEKRA